MPSELILRVPRSDDEGGFVLINITSNGPSPLDLQLLATEGESPYITNLKHSHVQTYRAKASQLNESQWEALLLSVLLRHASEKAAAVEAIEKLETTATITKEKLLIIFRKNISGITQRLGEIPLGKDEDQEIDSIGWAGTAAVRSTDLEKEVEDLKGKNSEQKNVIGKLNQQLQDLIEAKIQHEKDLLEKFRELLNAKKLKIRDLHRVLAGAKIAPQKASHLRTPQESSSRTPAASRTAKRKAKGDPTTDAASASSTDAEEVSNKMSADEEHGRPQMFTPERSNASATEDETDDDLDSAPVAQPNKAAPSKPPAAAASPAKKPVRAYTPPPRRELPFPSSRKPAQDGTTQSPGGQRATETQVAEEKNDDGDETSDDEL